jgi:hypothetical protein
MTPKELSDIRRKLKVLNYATEIGNAAAACRRFGISGETFYSSLKGKHLTKCCEISYNQALTNRGDDSHTRAKAILANIRLPQH